MKDEKFLRPRPPGIPKPPKPRPGVPSSEKPTKPRPEKPTKPMPGFPGYLPGFPGSRPVTGFPGGRGAATPGGFNPSVVTEDKKNQARGNAIMKKLNK